MKRRIIVVSAFALIGISSLFVAGNAQYYLASFFFSDDLISDNVRSHYRDGSVSVLIVPGHDNENYGTEYGGVREADITRKIGEYLYAYLGADNKFRPTLVRDRNGYTREFAGYFSNQQEGIGSFIQSVRKYFNQLVGFGFVQTSVPQIQHNWANTETQYILYGINKWANENAIDIVLHIHINDYPRRGSWEQKYTGFSIYVPNNQLPNYALSKEIAEHLRSAFSQYWASSDLPLEQDTIIEGAQLIAIGSNGSLRSGSALIEYGYIYESKFHTEILLKEVAFRTYEGIRSFFDEQDTSDDFSWLFPYQWNTSIRYGATQSIDVVALQAALTKLNLYPPIGETFRNCPINGNFRNCTRVAVQAFQEKYGIDTVGTIGPQTRAKLNELFSGEEI